MQVACNVATGPRPTVGGAAKPVQINLRDEGFDGEQSGNPMLACYVMQVNVAY